MKTKIFVFAIILIAFMFCGFGTASAMTEAERQALILQLQTQIAELTRQINEILGQNTSWCHTFNNNLGFNQSGTAEVGYLHIALQKEGFPVSDSTNIYGTSTESSVKAFQEKYNISPSLGYTGPLTREKLNELYGCATNSTLPIIDIKANNSDNPITISTGGSVVLSWSSANATSCTASGDWSDTIIANGSGSATKSGLTFFKTFTITCHNSTGSTSDNVIVNIYSEPGGPYVDIKANNSEGPITISKDSSVALSWISDGVTNCTATGGWIGTKASNGTELTENLTVSKTYAIACQKVDGSLVYDGVRVEVVGITIPITVDLRVNNSDGPVSIPNNTSATIVWTSTNATSCTASDDWTGAKAVNGQASTGNLASSVKKYTITCSNATNSTSDSVVVNVGSQAVVDLKINDSDGPTINVTNNTSAEIKWTSSNATSCEALGDWSGVKATNGLASTGNLTASKTYIIICSNATSTATDSITLNVGSKVTVDLKANNTDSLLNILTNTSATLSWTSTNATSCTASGDWTGAKTISGTDSTGNLTASKTYTIICSNASSSATDKVVVNASPVTVDIKANGSDGQVTVYMIYNAINKLYWVDTNLTWTSANATSCTASGNNLPMYSGWSGSKNVSGSERNSRSSSGNSLNSVTFTITCRNSAGATATDSVTVVPSQIKVDIKANDSDGPVNVTKDTSAILKWTTSNVTSCVASGDWSGAKPISEAYAAINFKSESTEKINSPKTYIITCYGPLGNMTDSVTVNPGLVTPVVTVDIKANNSDGPINISNNTSATLKWTSTNATSCTASGNWAGSKYLSSEESTQKLISGTGNYTFTITCRNATGEEGVDSVVVGISSQVTVDLKANGYGDSIVIESGTLVTLSWTSEGATYCTPSGRNFNGSKPAIGSELFDATQDIISGDYSLTCTGPGGTATDTVTVNKVSFTYPDLYKYNVSHRTAPGVDIKAFGFDGPITLFSKSKDVVLAFASFSSSCYSWGDWTGRVASSNQYENNSTVTLSGTPTSTFNGYDIYSRTYYVTCGSNAINTYTDSVTVNWALPKGTTTTPPASTVDLKINGSDGPLNIISGDQVALTWSSSADVLSCNISNTGSGGTANMYAQQLPNGSKTTTLGTGANIANFVITATCNDSLGKTATNSVSVNISPQKSTVDIKANDQDGPVTIYYGEPLVLSWSSTGATFCTLAGSDGWHVAPTNSNSTNRSGTESIDTHVTISNPMDPNRITAGTVTKTYTFKCAGDYGGLTSPAGSEDRVTVNIINNVVADIHAKDWKGIDQDIEAKVYDKSLVTLTWSSINATSCIASRGQEGWAGTKATSGSEAVMVNRLKDTAFVITCTGPRGVSVDYVQMIPLEDFNIYDVNAKLIDIKANGSNGPITIPYNTSATLSWVWDKNIDSRDYYGSCYANGAWSGTKRTTDSMSTGNLTSSKTYTINCSTYAEARLSTDSVTINVTQPAGCANDGQKVYLNSSFGPTVCCGESTGIKPSGTLSGGSCIMPTDGSKGTCINGWSQTCGNGVCGTGEDKCSCSTDCSATSLMDDLQSQIASIADAIKKLLGQ